MDSNGNGNILHMDLFRKIFYNRVKIPKNL